MSELDWLTRRPIAHRGLHDASAGIVENTLPAAQAAVDGDYGIEVDLQLSADGVPMVFHDDTLDRLTEGTGPVAAQTADALGEIPFKIGSATMPTLAALLSLVDGRVPLVIELKSDFQNSGALEQAVAAQLETYTGPVAVMSFDPRMVEQFRQIAPAVTRGIVAESFSRPADWPELTVGQRRRLRWMTHLPSSRPHFVAYGIRDLPAFMPLALRALGRPLLTWTVRSPADRTRAARWTDQMIFEGFRP
ncbi:MAG: glycerophosphodiester phosphodiesterase [Rhodobiaceae bacterium]|nr:glycerophosphodiester phosphodiesterase [Rhodobiaceae bacterium]